MEWGEQNKKLIDSSVWIAYFDKKDIFSEKAKARLQNIFQERAPLFLTDFVIQEILTVLFYKQKNKIAEVLFDFIEFQTNIQIISSSEKNMRETLLFAKQRQYKPKLSFTDWNLLFLARQLHLEVITFDKQLHNAYKRMSSREFL